MVACPGARLYSVSVGLASVPHRPGARLAVAIGAF